MSQDLYIQIYEGVNDNPLPPSPINNCNADYLIAKHNILAEKVAERENLGQNIIEGSKLFYFDSVTGSDENGDGSLAAPFASLDGLVRTLNTAGNRLHGDISLELRLNGIFDAEGFDFSKLAFTHQGSGRILVRNKNSQTNFILQIDSAELIFNKQCGIKFERCDFLFRGSTAFNGVVPVELEACNLLFLTNTAQLFLGEGFYLKQRNCSITSEFGATSVVCQAGSYLDLFDTSLEYKTTISTGYIYELLRGATAFLNASSVISDDSVEEKTNLIYVERGAKIFCEDAEVLSNFAPIFEDNFSFLELNFSNFRDTAKEIAIGLNSLTGTDRISIDSIDGSETLRELSAEDVRNKLLELTGDDRLSVTAIRDLNYLQYYSSLTEEFLQPDVGVSIEISIGSTNWLQATEHIFIQGGGTYKIISVIDSERLEVRNIGEIINAAKNTPIRAGAKITISGRPGFRGFTNTTSIFQQPGVGETAAIQFEDDSAFYVGSVIYVENADYFGIAEINRETHIASCVRLGYITTIALGTNIAIGSRVVLAGLKGDKGDYPTASLVANFDMPALGGDVTISLNDSTFFNIGSTIHIEQVGVFKVVDVGVRTLTIRNLGIQNNLPEATKVFSPKQVIIIGATGLNTFSKVWEESNVNSTFGIFCDNVDWCSIGQDVRIGNIGIFKIQNIIGVANALTLTNSNEELNGDLIAVGTPVLSLGPEGDKGDPGDNFTTAAETKQLLGGLNSFFELVVERPEFFYEGAYIHIDGLGTDFIVNGVDENDRKIQFVCIEEYDVDYEVLNGTKIYLVGSPSLSTISVAEFVQPEINYSVTVETYQKTTEFFVGGYCYIKGGGYYLVIAVTERAITIKNVWHYINENAGTPILASKAKMLNEYPEVKTFKLRSEFIQPAKNGTVEAEFYNWQFLKIGDVLRAPSCGYYYVNSINSGSSQVFLSNLGYGYLDEKAAGEIISLSSLFYISPPRGETTYNGNHTYTTEDFIMPAEDAYVDVEVQNSDWIFPGMFLFIEGAGNSFKVLSKSGTTIIRILNSCKIKNNLAIPGNPIISGASVSTGVFTENKIRERHYKNISSSIQYALLFS